MAIYFFLSTNQNGCPTTKKYDAIKNLESKTDYPFCATVYKIEVGGTCKVFDRLLRSIEVAGDALDDPDARHDFTQQTIII
jgi:hypothetical protein